MAHWDNHPCLVRHGVALTSVEYGTTERQRRLSDLTTMRVASGWTTMKSQNSMPSNVPAMAH
jgi:hypothetical protein